MKKLFKIVLFASIMLFCLTGTACTAWAGWQKVFDNNGGASGEAIAVTPDGYIWVGFGTGISEIRRSYDGTSWEQIPVPSDVGAWEKYFTVDTSGRLCIIGSINSYYWNGSGWTRFAGHGWGFTCGAITAPDGRIWVITDNNVGYWNGSSWVQAKPPFAGRYFGLAITPNGRIWVGNEDGYSGYYDGSWHALGTGGWYKDEYMYGMVGCPDNSVWRYGGGGVGRIKADGTFETTISHSGKSHYAGVIDLLGRTWVGGYVSQTMYYDGSWHNGGNPGTEPNDFALGLDGTIWTTGYDRSGYDGSIGMLAGLRLNQSAATQTSITLNLSIYDTLGVPSGTILQRGTSPNSLSDVKPVSGTSCSDTGLNPSTVYYYRLKYEFMGKDYYSPIISAYTRPANPVVSGNNGGLSWQKSNGRGWVTLSWPSVPTATGYKLYVFDGNVYRAFDLGNTTSWDSRIAKIYPSETVLDGFSDDSQSGDLFLHDQTGYDLRDDPNKLYIKTIGTTYNNSHNYWFRVTSYNVWGESDLYAASALYSPTLPVRTDALAPTGTVTVTSKEGLEKTFDREVTVSVNIQDTLSGVWKLEFSNDGTSYTPVHEAVKNSDGGTDVSNYINSYVWTLSPGAGTKTVYVRVTDAVGNQNVITDAIALAEDMFPPTVTLKINDGAESTTNPSVTLEIIAQDNASVDSQLQMAFSNDGKLWSNWESFYSTKTWDITDEAYGGNSSPGIKTVYVRICDAAQNIGLARASIGYNPTPPTGVVTVVEGSSGTYKGKSCLYTNSDSPTLNLNFSGVSFVRFDVGFGWGDWETYEATKTVYLAKYQGVNRIRVQVKDVNGVVSQPIEALIVVDQEPPEISMLKGKNNATATTSGVFNMEMYAEDNLSERLQYRVKVDSYDFGQWYDWNIGDVISVSLAGNGLHTILIQVKDLAGNITASSLKAWKI